MSRSARESAAGSRRWCFADQLGRHFLDHSDQRALLIESRAAFERPRFHRRKAHLVLWALRHRAGELGDQALFLQTRTYREIVVEINEAQWFGAESARAVAR
jgi:deoxyribodipyrimidine photolyase-related protein